MSSADAAEWQFVMENEMSALRESKIFDLTQRPKHKSVIDGMRVYTLKEDCSSKKKYKGRFVAKGFTEKENIDYGNTFSPTAVRMLMDVAVHENLILHYMDLMLMMERQLHIFMLISTMSCMSTNLQVSSKEVIWYKNLKYCLI